MTKKKLSVIDRLDELFSTVEDLQADLSHLKTCYNGVCDRLHSLEEQEKDKKEEMDDGPYVLACYSDDGEDDCGTITLYYHGEDAVPVWKDYSSKSGVKLFDSKKEAIRMADAQSCLPLPRRSYCHHPKTVST